MVGVGGGIGDGSGAEEQAIAQDEADCVPLLRAGPSPDGHPLSSCDAVAESWRQRRHGGKTKDYM